MSIMHLLSEKITGKGIPDCSKMKEAAIFVDKNGAIEVVHIPKTSNRAKYAMID